LLSAGFSGKFKALGTPDRFVTHGNRDELLLEVSLDGAGIASEIEQFMGNGSKPSGGLLQRLVFRKNGVVKNSTVSVIKSE